MYNFYKYDTKLAEKYHQAFVNEIFPNLKFYKDKGREIIESQTLLYKRKAYLNKQFKFTNKNILLFEQLSRKYSSLQCKILEKYNYLKQKSRTELTKSDGSFDDIEIEVLILFLRNDDILYTTKNLLFLNDDTFCNELNNKNYSDYEIEFNDAKKHFAHFFQSRLFNDVFNNSYLSLKDVLNITDISYEIKIDYQTFVKLK